MSTEITGVLKKAGVSFSEFAVLAGVSRNMVYKWSRGSKPHPLREKRVSVLLDVIRSATDSGELPIDKPYNSPTEASIRINKIKAIVTNTLKKSAAPT